MDSGQRAQSAHATRYNLAYSGGMAALFYTSRWPAGSQKVQLPSARSPVTSKAISNGAREYLS